MKEKAEVEETQRSQTKVKYDNNNIKVNISSPILYTDSHKSLPISEYLTNLTNGVGKSFPIQLGYDHFSRTYIVKSAIPKQPAHQVKQSTFNIRNSLWSKSETEDKYICKCLGSPVT